MPLGIDFTQILLHLFNVIILFAGLYFLLYNPVKKFMEKREDYYRSMDEEKNSALEQARQYEQDYRSRMKGVEEEISNEKRNAEKELLSLRDQRTREAREEADRIISRACEEAERQRTEIVEGAKDDISGLIDEAADKLLLEGTTDSFYDAFLEDAERSVENV